VVVELADAGAPPGVLALVGAVLAEDAALAAVALVVSAAGAVPARVADWPKTGGMKMDTSRTAAARVRFPTTVRRVCRCVAAGGVAC
jgi:hypothetical protein